MKYVGRIWMLLLLLVACSGKPTDHSGLGVDGKAVMAAPVSDPNQIILRARLKENGAIGYGYLYAGTVTEVVDGNMTEPQFTLVLMVGDSLPADFSETETYTLTFRRHEENVPYQNMPLTGFVDKNQTSWKLVSMVK